MTRATVDAEAVRRALATVRDPELDEPLVELGFIQEAAVEDGRIRIRLRLPTFWCAPNFAFLMASDVVGALRPLPGVERVEVELVDHAFSEEINRALAAGGGFDAAFPGETEGSLEELRRLFLRKALLRRRGALLRALAAAGFDEQEAASLRLADASDPALLHALAGARGELARYLELRARLGLPDDPAQPLFPAVEGGPSRLRVLESSLAFNTEWCAALLRTRYGVPHA
ncbi:MAG: iron-sulfur cluster assembly protein [Bacillota bacterium]|nr:iron-sulfur cluster assembly protein [Bacillota bacterium]